MLGNCGMDGGWQLKVSWCGLVRNSRRKIRRTKLPMEGVFAAVALGGLGDR